MFELNEVTKPIVSQYYFNVPAKVYRDLFTKPDGSLAQPSINIISMGGIEIAYFDPKINSYVALVGKRENKEFAKTFFKAHDVKSGKKGITFNRMDIVVNVTELKLHDYSDQTLYFTTGRCEELPTYLEYIDINLSNFMVSKKSITFNEPTQLEITSPHNRHLIIIPRKFSHLVTYRAPKQQQMASANFAQLIAYI